MSWIKSVRVGESSTGTVCLARSVDSPEKVAVVKSAKLADSELFSSLKREAKLLKLLRGNPFVVRCYGTDTSTEADEERFNVLIEHAPGGTLADLIPSFGPEPDTFIALCAEPNIDPKVARSRTRSMDIVTYYSYMLLLGISHIHRRGIVHNDIKPSNILVFNTRNGWKHLKLADFGKAVQKGGVHRKAADIYAFGQTVVEMIKDRAYYKESKLVMDFLNKCTEPDPNKRWTADMLLGHPLIVHNTPGECLAPAFERSNLIQNPNPFSDSDWIEGENMFSGGVISAALPLQPSPARPINEPPYELFPREGGSKSTFHACLDEIRDGLNRDRVLKFYRDMGYY